jgi:Uncharacterized protein conserved in bacteria (DUF2252)
MLLAGGSNYRYLRLARDTWPTEEHPISFMSDTAFKAVGVGSVETFCAVGLFVSADGDPHFLQKEAGKSVLECLGPKFSGHPGRRVVEGQHVMQASSDIFLGCSQDDDQVDTSLSVS